LKYLYSTFFYLISAHADAVCKNYYPHMWIEVLEHVDTAINHIHIPLIYIIYQNIVVLVMFNTKMSRSLLLVLAVCMSEALTFSNSALNKFCVDHVMNGFKNQTLQTLVGPKTMILASNTTLRSMENSNGSWPPQYSTFATCGGCNYNLSST